MNLNFLEKYNSHRPTPFLVTTYSYSIGTVVVSSLSFPFAVCTFWKSNFSATILAKKFVFLYSDFIIILQSLVEPFNWSHCLWFTNPDHSSALSGLGSAWSFGFLSPPHLPMSSNFKGFPSHMFALLFFCSNILILEQESLLSFKCWVLNKGTTDTILKLSMVFDWTWDLSH